MLISMYDYIYTYMRINISCIYHVKETVLGQGSPDSFFPSLQIAQPQHVVTKLQINLYESCTTSFI